MIISYFQYRRKPLQLHSNEVFFTLGGKFKYQSFTDFKNRHLMTRNIFHTIAALSSLLLIFIFLAKITWGAREDEEVRVKTAYIYNFCKYVTWPASTEKDSLDICILGLDPLVEQLAMLEKKKIQSRNIVVNFYSADSATQCCEVLFICDTEKENVTAITESLRGLPVLTISDIKGFGQKGGIIELVKQENKIRFIINKQRLDEAKLTISSRLLKLATIINGEHSQ